MATTISTQDIVDAKRDIEDIGKAVNEKVIVSPRYGEDFKSLPMLAAEVESTITEWQDAVNTIVVNDGVPALAVSDASGLNQQQINNLDLTPFHFGAVGDGSSHKLSERYATLAEAQVVYPHAVSLDDEIDWCAVQALFDAVRFKPLEYLKHTIDISGKFMLTRGLYYEIEATNQNTNRTVYGDFVAVCTNMESNTHAVLSIHGGGIQFTGVISIDCMDKAKYGISVSYGYQLKSGQAAINFGIKLGRCFIHNAKIFNIAFNDSAMFSTLDFYRGSGGGNKYTTSVSNIVHRYINELSTESTLTVATLPEFDVTDTPIFVEYNGLISVVKSIDRVNKTITTGNAVKDSSDGSLLELKVFYGGGILTAGPNTAGLVINQMSTILDVIGVFHTAMYPCQINYFCSEFSQVALFSMGLVGGIVANNAYFEGDVWQYIQLTDGYNFSGTSKINFATGVDINKVDDITWGRSPTTGLANGNYIGVKGAQLYEVGVIHTYTKMPYNGIPNGYSINFNKPHSITSEHANNLTVSFTAIVPSYNRLFGYDTQNLIVTGDGTNGEPTGSVTFVPPEGYTINGKAENAVFSSFTTAPIFTAKLHVATKNIIISPAYISNFIPLSSSIPLVATDASKIEVNTRFCFRSSSTTTGLPTPTTGTMVDGNIATYFSVGKLGESHYKTQLVEFPSLSEKWERVYRSANGYYGAWRLVNYQVSKGTTAQRPANPQLGMRYYDTTLLASGKPIEWSGSDWIDMTGTVV